MDRIKKYQKAILDFLSTYAEDIYGNDPSGIETQVIADKKNHHYLLLRLGWSNKKHIHFCPFQFDIKNDKIWIQVNNTETMVADELMQRGVPKSAIVLAFHREDMRQFTGFAVA
ncbi:MAG: XisI protein [Saprospiraceae bacterium]